MENPNSKNPIYMQHEKPSSSKGLGFYMHYEIEREREREREKKWEISLFSGTREKKMGNLFILKQSSA
jgi:hypothetical protein